MPVVSHPEFPKTVRQVTTEQVKEWTDAGWKKVKAEDEPKVLAEAGLA